MNWKYSIGDKVYDKWSDCEDEVVQKRIVYGQRYYRLRSGAERHEDQLI